MDCGAGIYCIGSVHLEHAKTEYSSLFHYAIAPFSAAESSHLPTWHRACFISEQFCLGIPSYLLCQDNFGQLAEPSPRNMACTLSSSQHIL